MQDTNISTVKLDRTFLFVDDDESTCAAVKRISNIFDVNVQTANNAHNALALIQSDPDKYFLILTDQNMDDMNGDELLEIVNDKWPFIRRAMLSGEIANESIVKAYETGRIFRFLEKPVPEDRIKQLVEDACKHVLSESSDGREIFSGRQKILKSCFERVFNDNEFKSSFKKLEIRFLLQCQRIWYIAGLSRLPLIDKDTGDFKEELKRSINKTMDSVKGILDVAKDGRVGFELATMMKQFDISGVKKMDRYLDYNESVFSALIQKIVLYGELLVLDKDELIKVTPTTIEFRVGDRHFWNDIYNPVLASVPKGIEISALVLEVFMLLSFLKIEGKVTYEEGILVTLPI